MQTLPNGFDIPLPFLQYILPYLFLWHPDHAGCGCGGFPGSGRGQAARHQSGLHLGCAFLGRSGRDRRSPALAYLHTAGYARSGSSRASSTQWYLASPILDMINIRNGGLGIPGAIIGGALALWFYCRNKKISFLTLADTVIPGVALAQAIGRWGNFFNQELYG